MHNFEARTELTKTFKRLHESVVRQIPRGLARTVCRLAARKLLNKALQMCEEHVGYLLKSIKSIQITQREDFGKGCQSVSSELYTSTTQLTSL